MNYLWITLICLFSYLLGSIPFGLIVGKTKNIDLREHGSKNIGATNALRVLGLKLGIVVFILDVLKGALIVSILRFLDSFTTVNVKFLTEINNLNIVVIYGFFAVIGHVFPIFSKFIGGKAVSTALGAIISTAPFVGGLGFLVFIVVILISGYASLGSVIAASVALILGFLDVIIFHNSDFLKFVIQVSSFSLIIMFIILKHIPNMRRLIKGEERRFPIGLGKKKTDNK